MNGSHVRFQKWLFKILVEIIYLQSSSWPAEQAMIKMDKAWFCLVNYVVFDWGFPTLCLSMLYLDSDEWWWMYLKIDTTRYYLSWKWLLSSNDCLFAPLFLHPVLLLYHERRIRNDRSVPTRPNPMTPKIRRQPQVKFHTAHTYRLIFLAP